MRPQTLKGFRDILPIDAKIRQKAIEILKNTFEKYGFQPLETPTIEYASTLLGKYGDEADKLVYTFKDRGDRPVGLRYDLTVPVSKVLAIYANNQISLPFKRYQIQNVFRAENPQRGRYREFTQCDIDIFGIKSSLADAEIISIIYEVLKNLGFRSFKININSRQVLFKILEESEIKEKDKQLDVLRSIDKLGKITKDDVKKELINKGFNEETIENIFKAIESAKPNDELSEIFNFLKFNNVSEEYWNFNPTTVRGLDYYTGPIFETIIYENNLGSITGGGRYDNLVSQLGGPDIAATGTSFGFERIIDLIKDLNIWKDQDLTTTKVLVTIFSPNLVDESIEVCSQLRAGNIPTELYLDPNKKLDIQLKYADRKKIPWIVIIGPKEKEKKIIKIKNLQNGLQKQTSLQDFLILLK